MPSIDSRTIPYPITNKEHIKTLNAEKSDVVFHHFGQKKARVIMVQADNEQQAIDCRHEIEKELSQENRDSRCRIPGNNGGYRICMKDCSSCKNKRSGKPFSLEMEMENNGFDAPFKPSIDPFELIEIRISLEATIEKLRN